MATGRQGDRRRRPRILLLAFGSRGDVQPILALAQGLTTAGYPITIGAGNNFRTWIEQRGFRFADVGVDMHELLNSNLGKEWTENSTNSAQEARNMKRVLDAHRDAVGNALTEICADADVIISNLPTFGMAQAIAEKFNKQHIRVMLAPLTPTNDPAATMVPLYRWGSSPLNHMAAYAGIYFIYWITRDSINWLRTRLGLAAWGYGDYVRAWNRMPVLYGVSPRLMPQDPRWLPHAVVTGYWYDEWHHEDVFGWQPPAALAAFLERNPRPVYMGFGSMGAKDPQTTLIQMLQALDETGHPGIIYSGWAGLQDTPAAQNLPPHVFMLDGAPHDWLFPRMGALIHHGGAGTTATGVRAGVPATVVAHMADQPYWGRRLYELGVGAKPLARHRLSAAGLAQAIRTMLNDPHMQDRAAALGQQVRAEQGVIQAVAAIERFLEKFAETSFRED